LTHSKKHRRELGELPFRKTDVNKDTIRSEEWSISFPYIFVIIRTTPAFTKYDSIRLTLEVLASASAENMRELVLVLCQGL